MTKQQIIDGIPKSGMIQTPGGIEGAFLCD